MILGISLVVDELNKGPRLLFSYPDQQSSYHRRNIPGIGLFDSQQKENSKDLQKLLSYVNRQYDQYFRLW
jgi:hypothetical protein